jgi:hypothetical protein
LKPCFQTEEVLLEVLGQDSVPNSVEMLLLSFFWIEGMLDFGPDK